MSLLLTRHVHQYCIDISRDLSPGIGAYRLHTALLEPFADEVAVKTIMLDDQHALHGGYPP
jgi:hypothetical protein